MEDRKAHTTDKNPRSGFVDDQCVHRLRSVTARRHSGRAGSARDPNPRRWGYLVRATSRRRAMSCIASRHPGSGHQGWSSSCRRRPARRTSARQTLRLPSNGRPATRTRGVGVDDHLIGGGGGARVQRLLGHLVTTGWAPGPAHGLRPITYRTALGAISPESDRCSAPPARRSTVGTPESSAVRRGQHPSR